jgi:hypothetical protein
MTDNDNRSSADIVDRLRDRDAIVIGGLFHAIPALKEAADEIERLRQELNFAFNRIADKDVILSRGVAQGAPPPSKEQIAAQVLLAMSDKVGSDTYGVSYALKINKGRAERAAESILSLIATQPPAAQVEVPPDVMERRRKGLPDYERPPLGQPPSWLQEQEKKPAPLSRCSAGNSEPAEVEEDDPDVLTAARAIAEHGFGRPWDDFHVSNAFDTDQNDLIEYGRAAVSALRSRALPQGASK